MIATSNLVKDTYNLTLQEDSPWSMYVEGILHNPGFIWAWQQQDNPQQLDQLINPIEKGVYSGMALYSFLDSALRMA